jgi:hypothetical protein
MTPCRYGFLGALRGAGLRRYVTGREVGRSAVVVALHTKPEHVTALVC